ncbi:hypothetical protein T484DRAFT_1829962 [Baffinella frigidus]|nr:hypothetical protein T484DRAFT_1829962 [Cryptophyta sp. CCMP2293]
MAGASTSAIVSDRIFHREQVTATLLFGEVVAVTATLLFGEVVAVHVHSSVLDEEWEVPPTPHPVCV